jgi:hypothetical protein
MKSYDRLRLYYPPDFFMSARRSVLCSAGDMLSTRVSTPSPPTTSDSSIAFCWETCEPSSMGSFWGVPTSIPSGAAAGVPCSMASPSFVSPSFVFESRETDPRELDNNSKLGVDSERKAGTGGRTRPGGTDPCRAPEKYISGGLGIIYRAVERRTSA